MGRSNTFLIINLNTRFRNLDIYLLKFFWYRNIKFDLEISRLETKNKARFF